MADDLDGWGDDDDVDLDLDEIGDGGDNGWGDDGLEDLSQVVEDTNSLHHQAPGQAQSMSIDHPLKPPAAAQHQQTQVHVAAQDGWDDDDLFVDDETTSNGEAQQQTHQPQSDKVSNNGSGWGDDDDLLFSESEVGSSAPNTVVQAVPPVSPSRKIIHQTSQPVDTTNNNASGWGDDDEDFFGEEDDLETALNAASNVRTNSFDETPSKPKRSVSFEPQPAVAVSSSALCQELGNYLDMLPHLGVSVNAIFQAEYNTPEKAAELVQYYTSRPALAEYTVEKELPRMDYTLLEPILGQQVPRHVTDKASIACALLDDNSGGNNLTARCANQSLLADALQVMTGGSGDGLIRSQYMATAVATNCQFQVDLGQKWVECDAQLDLILPTTGDSKWKVADLKVHVSIVVDPNAPFIEYRLDNIAPVPRDASWSERLASATAMLESLDLPPMNEVDNGGNSNVPGVDNFRDIFLQNSQAALQTYAVGMRTALSEIDKVSGLSDKIQRLPGFLPDDLVQAAEVTDHQIASKERPKSLLGGLVNKLKESVALPEEDPSLYDEWRRGPDQQQLHQQHQPTPQLYNNAPPRLYGEQSPQTRRVPLAQSSNESCNTTGSSVRSHSSSTSSAMSHQPSPLRRKKEVYRKDSDDEVNPLPLATHAPSTRREPARSAAPEVAVKEAGGQAPKGLDNTCGREVQSADSTPPPPPSSASNFPKLYRSSSPSTPPPPSSTAGPAVSSTMQHVRQLLASSDDDIRTSNENDDADDETRYDPATGVRSTRKRWANPRPGSRRLSTYTATAAI